MKSRTPTKERAQPKQQSLPLSLASATAIGRAGQVVISALVRLLLEAAKAAVRRETPMMLRELLPERSLGAQWCTCGSRHACRSRRISRARGVSAPWLSLPANTDSVRCLSSTRI